MESRMSMSNKELSRFEILTQVRKKQLKRSKAARILGISPRQFRRLLRRFISEGPKGLISRRLGAPSPHKVVPEQEKLVLGFLNNPDHHDFGPTLTHEYLTEQKGLQIAVSSVRNIMTRHGCGHEDLLLNFHLQLSIL